MSAARLDADWLLFSDWCASWDLHPMPSTADVVADFLAAFPAGLGTQGRRVRAIRREHERQGMPLDLPSAYSPRAVLWRDGDRALDVGPALAQLPKYRADPGLRGRRDGFLLVLAGFLRLSREQCRALTPEALTITDGTTQVDGRRVPIIEPAAMCPACAVTRWLRVLGPAWRGNKAEVNRLLDATQADPDEHDCVVGFEKLADWRYCEFLLPSIDRHGWVRTQTPLSARAITDIVPRRRIATDWVEEVGPVEFAPTRYDGMSNRDFYDEQDRVDRMVAEALLASKEALAAAYRLDLDLDDAARARKSA